MPNRTDERRPYERSAERAVWALLGSGANTTDPQSASIAPIRTTALTRLVSHEGVKNSDVANLARSTAGGDRTSGCRPRLPSIEQFAIPRFLRKEHGFPGAVRSL